MAKTVEVVAVKPLTYQGRSYVPGECFDCDPVEASIRLRRGEIRAPQTYRTASLRTYNRRDMVAEP